MVRNELSRTLVFYLQKIVSIQLTAHKESCSNVICYHKHINYRFSIYKIKRFSLYHDYFGLFPICSSFFLFLLSLDFWKVFACHIKIRLCTTKEDDTWSTQCALITLVLFFFTQKFISSIVFTRFFVLSLYSRVVYIIPLLSSHFLFLSIQYHCYIVWMRSASGNK